MTYTVLDTQTGLTWQRRVPEERFTWEEAMAYAVQLKLDGGRWRLPTVGELRSIDRKAFPESLPERFWSGTLLINALGYAWGVNFNDGNTGFFDVGNTYRVRCVR